jgi:hypothetical protein
LNSAAGTSTLLHNLQQLMGDRAAKEVYLSTQLLTKKELEELRGFLEVILFYVSDRNQAL